MKTKLISIKDFAEANGVTTQAIYFAIKTRRITPVIIGKSKFIKESEKYTHRKK